MIKLKNLFAHRIFKIFGWAILILVALFIILIIARVPHYFKVQKTNDQILKIHSTKLQLSDVLGLKLPKDPGIEADKTIQGIDSNYNGIRDDVELAIFKEYPKSAKTRAVLLQNALVLQMEMTQPFLNKEIVGEVANQEDRAIFCSSENMPNKGEEGVIAAVQKYGKFISDLQFNTELRKAKHKEFYSYLNSGRIEESVNCDVDLLKLPN